MADAPAARTSLSRLAESYAVILCDVFGVLHDATRVFPAATAALAALPAGGGTVILVSNAAEPGAHTCQNSSAPAGSPTPTTIS